MFESTMYLCDPSDPFQPPDRRYRRSLYLLEHSQRPLTRLDDAITWDSWRFFRDWRQCRDDADRERLAQRHPIVATAHQLFTSAQTLKRAELEARLLARESDETIAAKCSLSPAAIRAFHDLFFSVRAALDAPEYISITAIDARVHSELSEGDSDVILKCLGYFHGPLMLDAAVRYFRNPPTLPARLDELDSVALKELHLMLEIRALILTMVVPASSLKKLMHIHAGFKQARAREENSSLDPAADGSGLSIAQDPVDSSVPAFLRERVRELAPADQPDILHLIRSAPRDQPESPGASAASLCG